MHGLSLCRCVLLLTAVFSGCYGDPTFSASPSPDVLVNRAVTLECLFSAGQAGVSFRLPGRADCPFQYCFSGTCGETSIQPDCPNNQTYRISLTATASWNNAVLYCKPAFSNRRSNNVTINITVPVTSVTLTPVQITVDVSQQTTLTCRTDYCNPAATVTWYKSSTVISSQVTSTTNSNSDGLHRTTSVLTYTGVTVDSGQQVYCIASNRQGQQVESNRGLLNVRYPPSSNPVITASPPGLQYDSGTRVNLTCQLSGGNPIATLSWRCKGIDMTETNQSNSNTAVSVLSLVMDSSYNNRQCTCTANHRLLTSTKSNSVLLTVFYNNVITSTLSREYVTSEHEQLQIKCDVDGNPLPNITWLFVQNNTVVKKDSNVNSSSLDITSANCLDHGSYKVTADNRKGPAAVRTTHVAVRCKPRLYEIDSQTPEKLGIGNNDSLQIFVNVLLYPPATQTQWKFKGKNNQSSVIENNKDGYRVTNTKGEIKQNVTLYKRSVNVEEYGSYTITVQNDVGTFSRIYYVDSARPPSLPTNVTLICDNPSHVELSWISNFNGGDSQTFNISYSTAGDSSYEDLEIISDGGYGRRHSYTPSIELQGTVWFTVSAFNMFGNSTSDAVHCTIVEIEEKASHQTDTVVGSVVGSVVFIVVILVLVIFLRRRYTCNCTCKIKMKIERIHENVKATDLSKDESQNSLAEQNVLGERSVYEELKEREAGNQYQELSPKEKQESKTETYESIQRVSADIKYEELSTVSKKQDQGDQTYNNSQTVTPTDVYVNTSFQN